MGQRSRPSIGLCEVPVRNCSVLLGVSYTVSSVLQYYCAVQPRLRGLGCYRRFFLSDTFAWTFIGSASYSSQKPADVMKSGSRDVDATCKQRRNSTVAWESNRQDRQKHTCQGGTVAYYLQYEGHSVTDTYTVVVTQFSEDHFRSHVCLICDWLLRRLPANKSNESKIIVCSPYLRVLRCCLLVNECGTYNLCAHAET